MLTIFIVAVFAVAEPPSKAPAVAEPQLRAELLRRVKVDQDARKALIEWTKIRGGDAALDANDFKAYEKKLAALKQIDAENAQWLKTTVGKFGWPTISLVGTDGAAAAWLLVQHADAFPKFQRRCLNLMTRLPKEEVSQANLAYLTDRVLLAEGKKQLYGTQFISAGGKWTPRPLEDESNVDKRRAAVGLPPMAEYVKLLEQQYGAAPSE